ncbi:hypothetical protein D9M70_66190 [compost metagenome]
MFGKVQRCTGEPLGAGHPGGFEQHGVGLLVEADVEEIDDGLPEVRALIDGPLVQGRVVVDLEVVSLIDEAPKGFHAGLANAFGVGLPEDVGHGLPLLFYAFTQADVEPAFVARELVWRGGLPPFGCEAVVNQTT